MTEDLPAREIISSFFQLSLSQRNEILGSLNLIDENDSHLPDFERHRRSLTTARENGQLEEIGILIGKMEAK